MITLPCSNATHKGQSVKGGFGMGRASGFWLAVARLGGVGTISPAPGTVATAVVGVPSAVLLPFLPAPWDYGVVVLVFILACLASARAASVLEDEDPRQVVIDELVGYLVTMVGLPVSPLSLATGFVAFRLFDIWKPWPVSLLDRRLGGGLGIVADDVAAGLYAHVCVWGVLQWVGR